MRGLRGSASCVTGPAYQFERAETLGTCEGDDLVSARRRRTTVIDLDFIGCPSPARGSHGSQMREPTYADSPGLTATPSGRYRR